MSLVPERQREDTIGRKLWQINWGLVFVVAMAGGIGLAMLYSAAHGSFDPWASRQAVRFAIGFAFMLIAALLDIRLWLRYAYVIYFATLALLVAVEISGTIGMGAQRWIDLKFIKLQPSEIMKVAMVLALARHFNGLPTRISAARST